MYSFMYECYLDHKHETSWSNGRHMLKLTLTYPLVELLTINYKTPKSIDVNPREKIRGLPFDWEPRDKEN